MKKTRLIFYELLKKYKLSGPRIHDLETVRISSANGVKNIVTEKNRF